MKILYLTFTDLRSLLIGITQIQCYKILHYQATILVSTCEIESFWVSNITSDIHWSGDVSILGGRLI